MEIKETIYEFISANGLFNEHYQTVIYRICSGLKLGQQTVKSALSSLHEDKRIKVQKDGDRIIVADGGVVFKGTVSCRPNSRYAHIVVAGQTEDIYVADKKDALNGDIVKVGYSFRNGKKEAFIVEIVERKNLLAIGTIVKASDGVVSFVPDDKSLSGKIFLNQTTNLNSMIGQKVSLKLTYVNSKVFKNKSSNMICGQIDKVIGLAGDPITENRAIALLYGFSKEFPGNVVSEAQQLPNKLRKEDYFGCEDFRDLNFVTIDPKTCKDMDDATYVEKTKNGYKIFVAIADVAHFVPENSEMYKEAKKRGTSCYLGDGVYPMYHEYLTNGICSLVEGDDRRVVCMIGEIDNNGKLQKYEIKRAVINSKHKLSNEDADEIYFCTNGKEKEFADIKNIIDLSFEASDVLAAMRKKRGAIAICSKEPSFVLDETKTKVLDVENSAELKSTKIIESFMVLANEISARFFIENAIPALYRVDDLPDEEKINTLRIVLNDLDINFGGENNPFEIQKLID
ncbi:MAG: RNB domain-containing ribonuclease, partial [Clostridia bacterium]